MTSTIQATILEGFLWSDQSKPVLFISLPINYTNKLNFDTTVNTFVSKCV